MPHPRLRAKDGTLVKQSRLTAIAALAAGLLLSACATAPVSTAHSSAPPPSSPDNPMSGQFSEATTPAGPQRDLTAQEKKVIMDAVEPSLRNPGSARYKWAKFPMVVTEDTVNYCAVVDAQSPYPAYNGAQAYIVEADVTGGHVTGATMGLIAGGKDFAIVSNMCAKYGLDPKKSS
jgi:hypothetical protein